MSTTQPLNSAWENPVKTLLRAGQPAIGATITVNSVEMAAQAANLGFDFHWIEMEHSPVSLETLRNIVLAARGLNEPSQARASDGEGLRCRATASQVPGPARHQCRRNQAVPRSRLPFHPGEHRVESHGGRSTTTSHHPRQASRGSEARRDVTPGGDPDRGRLPRSNKDHALGSISACGGAESKPLAAEQRQ